MQVKVHLQQFVEQTATVLVDVPDGLSEEQAAATARRTALELAKVPGSIVWGEGDDGSAAEPYCVQDAAGGTIWERG